MFPGLVCSPVTVIKKKKKKLTQKQPGEEMDLFPFTIRSHSPPLREVRMWELRWGHGGMLLTGIFSLA